VIRRSARPPGRDGARVMGADLAYRPACGRPAEMRMFWPLGARLRSVSTIDGIPALSGPSRRVAGYGAPVRPKPGLSARGTRVPVGPCVSCPGVRAGGRFRHAGAAGIAVQDAVRGPAYAAVLAQPPRPITASHDEAGRTSTVPAAFACARDDPSPQSRTRSRGIARPVGERWRTALWLLAAGGCRALDTRHRGNAIPGLHRRRYGCFADAAGAGGNDHGWIPSQFGGTNVRKTSRDGRI
jgi:hypothetical protein